MSPKFRVALTAFLIGLPADQATKIAVDRNLSYADRIEVIEGLFYLTHVRNTGAAFGLLSDGPPALRLVFFVTISLLAVGIIASEKAARSCPAIKLKANAKAALVLQKDGVIAGTLVVDGQDTVFDGKTVPAGHR